MRPREYAIKRMTCRLGKRLGPTLALIAALTFLAPLLAAGAPPKGQKKPADDGPRQPLAIVEQKLVREASGKYELIIKIKNPNKAGAKDVLVSYRAAQEGEGRPIKVLVDFVPAGSEVEVRAGGEATRLVPAEPLDCQIDASSWE